MFEFRIPGFKVGAMAALVAKEYARYDMRNVCCVVKPDRTVDLEATDGYVAGILRAVNDFLSEGEPLAKETRFPLPDPSEFKTKGYYHISVSSDSYNVSGAGGVMVGGQLPVTIDARTYRFPDLWGSGLIPEPGTKAEGGVAFLDGAVQQKLLKAARKLGRKGGFLKDAFDLWFNGPSKPVRFQLKGNPDFFGVVMALDCPNTDEVWRKGELPDDNDDLS